MDIVERKKLKWEDRMGKKNAWNKRLLQSDKCVLKFPFAWVKGLHERRRSTNVYGAAQQWSSVYGPADDAVEVGGGFLQLVHLRHAACKVLKALWRAAAWQSLIAAVQPGTQQDI